MYPAGDNADFQQPMLQYDRAALNRGGGDLLLRLTSGLRREHIMAESSCNLRCYKELEAAVSQELKRWVIESKTELINQRDVRYGTSEFQDHLKAIGGPFETVEKYSPASCEKMLGNFLFLPNA